MNTNQVKFSILILRTYILVTLNEKFVFTRPATVTGAYLFPSGEIIFHQMTLDRIENNQYILQNTDFNHSPGKWFFLQTQNEP